MWSDDGNPKFQSECNGLGGLSAGKCAQGIDLVKKPLSLYEEILRDSLETMIDIYGDLSNCNIRSFT